jgi:predicted flap endonuclease-1-like 5' DNA nuclease
MMRMLLLLLAVLLASFGGVLVLALLLWFLLSRSSREKEAPAIEIKMPIPVPVTEPEANQPAATSPTATLETPGVAAEITVEAEAEPPVVEEPSEPDDLKRIEGIGPKIASVLQAAGIETFAQLAATEVSRIEQILEEESPRLRRLANPGTWPEQAALAAADDWEALEALQQALKGGRRVGVA